MKLSSKPKVLLAISQDHLLEAKTLFEPEFDIAVCASLIHARELLNAAYDLIAVDVCFDESRMFEFLRMCKTHLTAHAIPFVAMRIDGIEMDSIIHQAIQIAVKGLGAEGYISLHHLPGQANERMEEFRNIIKTMIDQR